MRIYKSFFSIVAAIITGILVFGAAVSAQSTGGIGGRPANPSQDNPRSQSIFIFTIDRGETQSDSILLSNNSDQTKTIELYAVDGIVTNTGAYSCAQASEVKQGVGSWVTIDKTSVTLEAGKNEKVNFQLTTPQNADVGEHNGCIVFQEKANDAAASGNVRVLTRQAIRVIATIPGELTRELDIASFNVGTFKNNPSLSIGIKNTGNVSADVDAKVYMTSLFGNIVYENGGGYPVLANQKLDLSFINENRPMFGGWYNASAEISYDKRAGTFGTSDKEHLITKQTDKKVIFIAPTLSGSIILVVLILGIIAAVMFRIIGRRKQEEAEKTWKVYEVKKNDNIESIASKANISWKKLAAMNHITAPYIIEKGQKLKIPSNLNNRTHTTKRTPKS